MGTGPNLSVCRLTDEVRRVEVEEEEEEIGSESDQSGAVLFGSFHKLVR